MDLFVSVVHRQVKINFIDLGCMKGRGGGGQLVFNVQSTMMVITRQRERERDFLMFIQKNNDISG